MKDTKRKCINCGAVHNNVLMPIIPFELGGRDVPTNYAPVCGDCLNVIEGVKKEKSLQRSEATKRGQAQAKKNGKKIGRPQITANDVPQEIRDLFIEYQWGQCTKADIIRRSGLSKPTVYKYIEILQKGGK